MHQRKPRRRSHADTFSWSLRPGRTLAVLLVAGLGVLLSRGSSLAADAKFVSLAQGTAITGPPNLSYAGTFNIDIGPPFDGPLTEAYCVDLNHYIDIGDIEPQVTPDYPCQVVYILNTYYPHAAPVLAPTSHEAAAVQAAIWFFTDGYVISGPADIKTRAEAIIADANASNCVPVPVVPQSLAVTPASATNFLPADTTHSVLATLIGTDTLPLANYPITIDVTGVSGPQSFSGTTDGSGQFTINYSNTSAVAGSDTITAHVTFTVPVGLKFKLIDRQGIVLAGDPVEGKVQGSAQKNWVPAACGDGFINQAGELCDDGNLIDDDGCDSNCTPTGCGNGIPTAGELCDDGNQVNGDGCDNNCTPTACGNGVVTPPEQCEPPNVGDCTADCHLPEICFNFLDDDDDGLIDCLDPDCECGLIGRDPGAIRFGPTPGSDFFAVHGSFVVPTTGGIDPVNETLGIRLTNADGEILALKILPGTLRKTGRNRYHFRNRQAQRNRSGLARLDMRFFPRRGNWTFLIKTYGNLSKATIAQMQVQWVVGDDPFLNESDWLRTPQGWLLTLP